MIRASLEAKERRRPTASVMAIVGGGTVIAATTGLGLLGCFDRFKNYSEEKGAHAQTVPKSATKDRFMRVTESTSDEANVPTKVPRAGSTSSIPSTGTFRLRLHWEPGYMWQELPDEDWYCATCAICDPNELYEGRKNCEPQINCKENMTLAIMKCPPGRRLDRNVTEFTRLKDGSRVPFDFSRDGLDGDQIQAHETTLCLQRMKPDGLSYRPLKLRQCDSAEKEQHFFGKRSFGQAMELYPFPGDAKLCLACHHHPTNREQIFPEDCSFSRYESNRVRSSKERKKVFLCFVVFFIRSVFQLYRSPTSFSGVLLITCGAPSRVTLKRLEHVLLRVILRISHHLKSPSQPNRHLFLSRQQDQRRISHHLPSPSQQSRHHSTSRQRDQHVQRNQDSLQECLYESLCKFYFDLVATKHNGDPRGDAINAEMQVKASLALSSYSHSKEAFKNTSKKAGARSILN